MNYTEQRAAFLEMLNKQDSLLAQKEAALKKEAEDYKAKRLEELCASIGSASPAQQEAILRRFETKISEEVQQFDAGRTGKINNARSLLNKSKNELAEFEKTTEERIADRKEKNSSRAKKALEDKEQQKAARLNQITQKLKTAVENLPEKDQSEMIRNISKKTADPRILAALKAGSSGGDGRSGQRGRDAVITKQTCFCCKK